MPATNQALAKFSPRELRIGAFVAQGLRNKDIAVELGTTLDCIKQAMMNIFDKSGTWSRLEFALWWLRQHPR